MLQHGRILKNILSKKEACHKKAQIHDSVNPKCPEKKNYKDNTN